MKSDEEHEEGIGEGCARKVIEVIVVVVVGFNEPTSKAKSSK